MGNLSRENPFDSQAVVAAYDQWFSMPVGALVDRLEMALVLRMVSPRYGETALDVGSGTGHFCFALADRGMQVTGIDASLEMVRAAQAAGKSVRYRHGRAESLPFSDNQFDVVLSVAAMAFIASPQRAIGEMVRVLKPGGRLVVGALNPDSAFGRAYLSESQVSETPFRHAHMLSPADLITMLGEYGRVFWSSSVFFGLAAPRWCMGKAVEWLGQRAYRQHGALVVAKVVK